MNNIWSITRVFFGIMGNDFIAIDMTTTGKMEFT
jgi:hypothetical protein